MLPLRRNRSLQGGQLQLDNWEVEMADIRDKLLGPSANSCCNAASEGTALSLNGPHIVDAGQVEATMMASDESVNKLPLQRTASSEIVRINVGGTVFTTRRATIERIPETRLANLRKTDPNFDQATGEWFFDRNPALFGNVLDYLRSDELHFPHNYCGPSIKNELTYWNLDESCISPCCWNRYREFEEDKKIFQHIEDAFESQTLNECMIPEGADISQLSRWHVWRRRIYVFLEEPMSSRYAKIWTLMFLMIVLTSIGCLCMETLPSLRVPLENNPQPFVIIYDNATEATITELDSQMINNRKLRDILTTQPHPVLEQLDSFCTCFFTIEFIVRLIAAPDRISFWKSPMNIIDVLCVLPMWIKYIMLLSNVSVNMKLLAVYFLIMMLRVLRICRVLRMARHYTAVKILLLALKASLRELLMLLIFVFIVVLIFSVIIYYAEFFEEDTFQSIPHGYWWAIITLTTVGYGDMYPKSVMGYLVGAMCALTGILATGLPVPIIANNFNLYYGHALLKDALDHNRKIKSERRKEQELAMMMMIERASENDKEGKCIVKEEAV